MQKQMVLQGQYRQFMIEDGNLQIDNNAAERRIKPFVIGRKNWLFHTTDENTMLGGQRMIPRITIDLQMAGKTLQEISRMRAWN
jgi:hypothetical protein